MPYDRTVQRTTTTTRNGRYLPPPPPPPPSRSNRNNSVLGYWVPLIAIGTIAVGGLAAWVWSERENDEEFPEDKPARPPTGVGAPYPPPQGHNYPAGAPPPPQGGFPGPGGPQQQMPPPVGGEASSYYNQSRSTGATQRNDQTFLSRVSGVIGRTPSPQQFFDHASRQVTAGVAAAGAAAGAALSSIMEDDRHDNQAYGSEQRRTEALDRREEKEGFSDHERWSEEAEEKRRTEVSSRKEDKGKSRNKRSVAIVLSADLDEYEHDDSYHNEHASILSHLPASYDPTQSDLFVLIYTPTLQSLPPSNYQPASTRATSSLGGSYSNIGTPAVTPGSELASISPRILPSDAATSHFDALYTQALALVPRSSHIMPFTTPDGYVAMLRHLAPQVVYVSDTLSGKEGESIGGLKGWVGHTVVVVGDDGHGGLADTETETEDERAGNGKRREKYRWYEHSSMVGLGKEVEIVDAARIGDDWSKRVGGRE